MQEADKVGVVVIGAGLAGLTAAATAARAGSTVVVVEAADLGGRARTDVLGDYRLNQGPHALGRGQAWRILRELGVPHPGHSPAVRGARLVRGGKLVGLPVGPTGSLVARLVRASPTRWAGRSAAQWVASLGGGEVSDLARLLIRVTTYVTDLEAMPGDFAVTRLKGSVRGVSYLDAGFGCLADGLSSVASAAGATIRKHHAVSGISTAPGGWEVALAGGEVLRATAVVVAAGGLDATRRLLPFDPGWTELGPRVTAACLDLGLRGPCPSVVVGLDRPFYLARHAPPGDMAPPGGSVVHVMRYGARDPELDYTELRDYTRLAGIADQQIVEERFLAEHTITDVLPSPKQGLAGRPGVTVPGAEGLYVAGDWVGPTGWLSDAAMSSGQHAGILAARAAAGERTLGRAA